MFGCFIEGIVRPSYTGTTTSVYNEPCQIQHWMFNLKNKFQEAASMESEERCKRAEEELQMPFGCNLAIS